MGPGKKDESDMADGKWITRIISLAITAAFAVALMRLAFAEGAPLMAG